MANEFDADVDRLKRAARVYESLNRVFEEFCAQVERFASDDVPEIGITVKKEDARSLLLEFLGRKIRVRLGSDFTDNKLRGLLLVEDLSTPRKESPTIARISFDKNGDTDTPAPDGYGGKIMTLESGHILTLFLILRALDFDPWAPEPSRSQQQR